MQDFLTWGKQWDKRRAQLSSMSSQKCKSSRVRNSLSDSVHTVTHVYVVWWESCQIEYIRMRVLEGHSPVGRLQTASAAVRGGRMFPAVQLSIIKNKFSSLFILSSENVIKAWSYKDMQPKIWKICSQKFYKNLSRSLLIITFWYFSGFCYVCSVFQHFKICNLLDFLSP